jgi:hypothetical protein
MTTPRRADILVESSRLCREGVTSAKMLVSLEVVRMSGVALPHLRPISAALVASAYA